MTRADGAARKGAGQFGLFLGSALLLAPVSTGGRFYVFFGSVRLNERES